LQIKIIADRVNGMVAHAKKRRRSTMKKSSSRHRASWKGNLAFGLVSFPVQAVNALNREQSDIHFHQLHEDCHRRIQYKKVCPVHGEVTQDEIVSGYEYKKGKYVEVTDEELESVRTDRERSLTIDAFIGVDAVDPVYFDGRMYYLIPEDDAARAPYSVVLHAMQREERCGIGMIVLSGKEQLALVRPLDSVLQMAMLNYDEELRPPSEVMAGALPRPDARQMKLAQSLIRNWTTDEFDFEKYDDEYRQRVKELIQAKAHGREIVASEEESPKIVNLMEALKQSLAEGKRTGSRRHRKSAHRKTG
jgi:DNA end-binding protein Ku